ncbi:hypothetical protein BU23DRAFT_651167 [Bimuria novae-zelandiae CBS 107.79]|uniref:Uncharacterized protein n=1 Tax=Bimuria novae-zelandiae CBS 107.79 TaxID=1447943 RepID=A0A6A5VRT3_9PLEO|nr:hypothetical protein BU23DRAFT_651167 [Bimuria novae-zelandiae CBS 107.79]
MVPTFISSSAAGALFGAALASSGVYLPSVITSQMHLSDFHMVKVFLAASASSSRYDGNILGGAMVSIGMTLTGVCPGLFVLGGGILGGNLYTQLIPYLPPPSPASSLEKEKPNENLTVQGKLGMSTRSAVLMYEVCCLVVINLATLLGPESVGVPLHPLLGGAAIGGAQAASLLLTGVPVGVSTAYKVGATYIWRTITSLSSHEAKGAPLAPLPPLKSVYFAAGIVAGSKMLLRAVPSAVVGTVLDIRASRGVLGLIMVLGVRLAGGCTSGHGISRMVMLSVSSIVTVGSMFLGGFGSALLV